MSFLNRLKKPSAASSAKKGGAVTSKNAAALQADAVETNVTKSASDSVTKRHAHTLIKPHVSEKAAHLAGRGVYVFDVPLSANKLEVRKAVEALYKVNVVQVRTVRGVGKMVQRGRIAGQRNNWKKALVELKKGQTLNLVAGV
jgi:large subunit ribosomal protein L23